MSSDIDTSPASSNPGANCDIGPVSRLKTPIFALWHAPPHATDILASNTEDNKDSGSLEEMEKAHIIRTLRETGGNKKKAAEIIGIERRTLYNKAKRLGIDLSRS